MISNYETILRILSIDDGILKTGMKLIFNANKQIKIISRITPRTMLHQAFMEFKPNIVIVDFRINTLDGIEIIQIVKSLDINIKIVVIADPDDVWNIKNAKNVGANSFFCNTCDKHKIIESLIMIYRGEKMYCAEMSHLFKFNVIDSIFEINEKLYNKYNDLSDRERIILKYIADATPLSQISNELNITLKTVTKHRSNILKKTKFRSHSELIKFALLMNYERA
jgi:DNA-binding NarL/FixJ family response regulator